MVGIVPYVVPRAEPREGPNSNVAYMVWWDKPATDRTLYRATKNVARQAHHQRQFIKQINNVRRPE